MSNSIPLLGAKWVSKVPVVQVPVYANYYYIISYLMGLIFTLKNHVPVEVLDNLVVVISICSYNPGGNGRVSSAGEDGRTKDIRTGRRGHCNGNV